MTLLELLTLTSLSIVAVSILFESGMLLSFLVDKYRHIVTSEYYPNQKWYHKPLFACVGCMASIWGVFFYSTYTAALQFRAFDIAEMLIVCLCCIPLNFIFDRLAGGKQ